MNFTLNEKSTIPAYLQLYEKIKRDIHNGAYPYNSKLPSKRTMAAETGLSTVTVEHSYALLCEEGYIEAKERSGFFVKFRFDDGFIESAHRTIPHPPMPMYTNTPDALPRFPFSVLCKTMRRVMNEYGETILEKSPNQGCPELCQAIKEHLTRNRGIEAKTEQIIIGSGAEYLYNLIVGLFGRNHIFALEAPSYQKIEQVYRAAGAVCDLLPLGADGIESRALANTKATVLHISPYRSFPSGITASASKKHEYLRWAEKVHGYIVEDDFESEFSVSGKPEETLFSLSQSQQVIYMNTFSKTISPALRIGYMILPLDLLPAFQDKLGFYSCTVPTFEQLVLAELISGGDFERHINRVRRAKRKVLTAKNDNKSN